LITGLCCSGDGDIINLVEWKEWISLQESTHCANHQIICASAGIERASFSKGGANRIDKNYRC
jgi:hypothetical protein